MLDKDVKSVASLIFRRRCLGGVARVQTCWRRRRRCRRSGFEGAVAEEPVDDEENDDDVGEDLRIVRNSDEECVINVEA